jgi:hypothetical protein
MRTTGLIVLLVAALLWAVPPYLSQRTMYLESPFEQNRIFSNPATISLIDGITFSLSTVLPLGDSLVFSDILISGPTGPKGFWALGILGAQPYQTGSSQATVGENNDFSFNSDFDFQRPRLSATLARSIVQLGSMGITGSIGFDKMYSGKDYYNKASPGIAMGVITPLLFNSAKVHGALFSYYHANDIKWWDAGIKIGILLQMPDSLLRLTAEGASSKIYLKSFADFPGNSFIVTGKILIHFRMNKYAYIMSGISKDAYYSITNGILYHAGLSYSISNFNISYDLGLRFGNDWRMLHKISLDIYSP